MEKEKAKTCKKDIDSSFQMKDPLEAQGELKGATNQKQKFKGIHRMDEASAANCEAGMIDDSGEISGTELKHWFLRWTRKVIPIDDQA